MKASAKYGWSFVDEQMQRQIGAGVTTAEAYERHFREDGYMESWLRYQKWIVDNPGNEVPAEVNRITSSHSVLLKP